MKGLRVQKSIRLGKFVRLNISKSGIGFSAGVGGMRVGSGPRGTFVNVDLPGTGLTYRKYLSTKKKGSSDANASKRSSAQALAAAEIPKPGLLAPGHEKNLVKAIEAYQTGNIDEALEHLLDAAPREPGAAIFAAAILTSRDRKDYRPVQLLEEVVQSDEEFPTKLMEKYLSNVTVNIDITANITAVVPVDGLAATLLLVELYQTQRRIREAMALLEDVEALAGEPLLKLSLCELYASRDMWDEIIECANGVESEDDITLEIMIYYGRAMQFKGLHEAAVTVFSKAVRRKKDRSPHLLNEAAYWRAISYQEQGKTGRANQEFQKIYAEAPDFRDVAQRVLS